MIIETVFEKLLIIEKKDFDMHLIRELDQQNGWRDPQRVWLWLWDPPKMAIDLRSKKSFVKQIEN